MEFADLDVIAAGAVVRDVSAQFDAYWNSASAYPAASIVGKSSPEAEAQVLAHWDELQREPRAGKYLDAVRDTPLVQPVAHQRAADGVGDRASGERRPGQGAASARAHRAAHAAAPAGGARASRSASWTWCRRTSCPPMTARARCARWPTRGVQVRVLTNSLSATDVGPVYAGYSKYREALLTRRQPAAVRAQAQPRPTTARPPTSKRRGIGSSSDAGLHAKTFAADRQRIFVGSFNLDPRSARLNTEMGVVLDSAPLASQPVRPVRAGHSAHAVRSAPGRRRPGRRMGRAERPDGPVTTAHRPRPA